MVLVGIVRVFREMRHGRYDEAELERRLSERGFINRFFGRVSGAIEKPWHAYPVGVLFGLGFDTATEVALLFIAAARPRGGAAVLRDPVPAVLFAAGMSLPDTIDGSFMNFAYRWAFSKPVRKVYYNITVTSLSVAVALVVGTVELADLAVDRLRLHGGAGAGSPRSTSTRSATSSSGCSSRRGSDHSCSGASPTSRSAGACAPAR